ncbi:MAG: alkaline phosphatase family protein [Halieaceae bacterium]|jgi:hypothetical protein|nr:alkaline phosphatase family protein [Halieaceae bacterium]
MSQAIDNPAAFTDLQPGWSPPDYAGEGIANLMLSLALGLGDHAADSMLPALNGLPPEIIARHSRVLLLVVDGLGDAMLTEPGLCPTLCTHRVKALSSVFPTTTAAGITTYLTGRPPARHGLTGWYTYIEVLDQVMAVLPGLPRGEGPRYGELAITPRELLGLDPLFARLSVPAASVSPAKIANSPFNRSISGDARSYVYEDMAGFFRQTRRAVLDTPGFTYAYWPELDRLGHDHGADSAELRAHLAELDTGFARLLEGVAGSDTLVLLSADHGMIDAPRRVDLSRHPEIAACLSRPLCGEPRVAFAYLRPEAREEFKERVTRELGHCLNLVDSRTLLADGWFGPGPTHPALAGRVGDFALFMHDGWMIFDQVPGEKRPPRMVAAHGGLSEAERLVPLVMARV